MKVSRLREILEGAAATATGLEAEALKDFATKLASRDDQDLADLKFVAQPKKKKVSGNTSQPTLKRKRGASEAMIRDYLDRLSEAYPNDEGFEAIAAEIEADKTVTKADVERLFNEVFKTERSFPEKRTKGQRVEDLRRERLNRIRFDAA